MFSKNVMRSLAGLGMMAALLLFAPALETQAAEVTSTVVSTTATVTGSALKIRQNASNGATVLGIAPKGETFTVTGVVDNEWLSVSYRGRTAYIASDYVALKTVRTTVVTQTEDEPLAEEIQKTEVAADTAPAETVDNTVSEKAVVTETVKAAESQSAPQSTVETTPVVTTQTQETAQSESKSGENEVSNVLLSENNGEDTEEETSEAVETEGSEAEAPAEETEDAEEEAAAEENTAAAEDNTAAAESAEAPAEEAEAAEITSTEEGIGEIAEAPATVSVAYSEEDVQLLAALIYCEAVGESYEGKVAVGEVVRNRVLSSRYPDSVSGVIYDPGQFSPVSSGKLGRILEAGVTDEACVQAAREALSGSAYVGSALRFNRIKTSSQGTFIGNHVFWG